MFNTLKRRFQFCLKKIPLRSCHGANLKVSNDNSYMKSYFRILKKQSLSEFGAELSSTESTEPGGAEAPNDVRRRSSQRTNLLYLLQNGPAFAPAQFTDSTE